MYFKIDIQPIAPIAPIGLILLVSWSGVFAGGDWLWCFIGVAQLVAR